MRWVTAAFFNFACDSTADVEDGYVCVVCVEGAEVIISQTHSRSRRRERCRGQRVAYIDVSRHFVPVTSFPETTCRGKARAAEAKMEKRKLLESDILELARYQRKIAKESIGD